jgi:K(+)-stimulated pyrophosphate-energized sodium pump
MKRASTLLTALLLPFLTMASEANLVIPDGIRDQSILYWGFLITLAGFLFGLFQFLKVKK